MEPVGRRTIQAGEQAGERTGLVDALRHQFNKEGGGTEHVHAFGKLVAQFGFSAHHVVGVSCKQQFGGVRVEVVEQAFHPANGHFVDACFFKHVGVVGAFGHNVIALVAQQGMARTSGIFVKLGHYLGG